MTLGSRFRHLVLRISVDETLVARRGFHVTDDARRVRIEQIGGAFVAGYNAALEEPRLESLASRLTALPEELQGFLFEGAAMALTILDAVTPWNRGRWRAFLEGPGANHPYMIHVGVGWAFARIPWLRRALLRRIASYDWLLRWLIVEGFGFHQAFFHPRRFVDDRERPGELSGYGLRAFDQGLGRCLWFVNGADAKRITDTIERFDRDRRSDLWSGVGLACAYAGGVQREEIETLRQLAQGYRLELAQGVAFAAKTRLRVGNVVPHVGLACEILCGTSVERAAAVTDECLVGLSPDVNAADGSGNDEPAFEKWRQRIQQRLAFFVTAGHNGGSVGMAVPVPGSQPP